LREQLCERDLGFGSGNRHLAAISERQSDGGFAAGLEIELGFQAVYLLPARRRAVVQRVAIAVDRQFALRNHVHRENADTDALRCQADRGECAEHHDFLRMLRLLVHLRVPFVCCEFATSAPTPLSGTKTGCFQTDKV